MTDRLYAMTIGIEDESAVVVAMVERAQAGRPVVAAASFERSGVESTDRLTIGCAEADVDSWRW